MNKSMYKAGAYIRLSREDGNKFEESNSIKNQRELIKQYIDNQDDITIYEYYSDDGRTGTNFDRPGFQQMIRDMNDRKIDCIIVKDLSRFGRNYIEVGRYIDYVFPQMNIRFISITDNIDNVKNPESLSSIVVPFKNLINDEYCRDISKKIKKVKEVQRLNGEVTNASVPYGYIYKNKKYIVDEEVRDIIVTIFDLFLSGKSTTEIAYKLNEEKIDSPRMHSLKLAKKNIEKYYYWSSPRIGDILRNRSYIGDLIQGKTTTLSYKVKVKTKVPKDKWIITENAHEAIIDEEKFDKVQLLLEEKNHHKVSKRKIIKTEFKGHLKCYECGKSMMKKIYWRVNDIKCVYYQCATYSKVSNKMCLPHKIKHNNLKEKVLDILNKDINYLINFEQNNISKYFKNNEIDKVKEEIKELQNKIDNFYKLKNNVLYDLKRELILYEDYEFYTSNYDLEIKENNKVLNNLKTKEFELSHEEISVKEYIKKFKKYYNLTDLNESIINDLIDTIYITKDLDVIIKYIDNDIFELIKSKERFID